MSLRKLAAALFLAGTGVWAAWSLYRIVFGFTPDFSVYYYSAKNLVEGRNVYNDHSLYTGFGYPPFTLFAYVPLTVLPYKLAQGFWVIISFASILLSIILTLKLIGKRPAALTFSLLVALSFWAFPTRFTLGMGQVNSLALTVLLAALWFHKKHRRTRAGICLWILLMIKPHFLVVLPILLLVGMVREVIVSGILLIIIAILTGAVFGWNLYETYLFQTAKDLLVYRGREIYYNQGAGAFFARLLNAPWNGYMTLLVSVFAYGSLIWLCIKKRPSVLLAFMVAMPVFLFIEPLSWQHHYVFLIPVCIYLWYNVTRQSERVVLLIAYILVAMNIKNPQHSTLLAPIVLSHVLWGNSLILLLIIKSEFYKKN